MSPNKFEGFSKEDLEYLKSEYGYNRRKYKSSGLCRKCEPNEFDQIYIYGHEEKNCRNPPYCGYHSMTGHSPTAKCQAYCSRCQKRGHMMRFCRKIKECVLCDKSGHNPLNCFIYSSKLVVFMARAKQLNRCAECLTLFTTDTNKCTHCSTRRVYWDPWRERTKIKESESQTETKNCKNQESQTELQHVETVIDKSQINQFKKVAILENELEHCVSVNNDLNSQLLGITQEIQQAHQKRLR